MSHPLSILQSTKDNLLQFCGSINVLVLVCFWVLVCSGNIWHVILSKVLWNFKCTIPFSACYRTTTGHKCRMPLHPSHVDTSSIDCLCSNTFLHSRPFLPFSHESVSLVSNSHAPLLQHLLQMANNSAVPCLISF